MSNKNKSETIMIEGTKWSQLPDINKVSQVENGEKWFSELRDILKKYNSLDRFGITLLHKHFKIEEDEIMLETIDVDKRTLFMRPVKSKDYLEKNNQSLATTSLKLVEDEKMTIQTTMWSKTPKGSKMLKISDSDAECFAELRQVLKKHNAIERYGIGLLHRHFDINEGEVLYESTDIVKRSQIIRPMKFENIPDDSIITTCWKLVDDDIVATLICVCGGYQGHNGQHAGP